MDIYIKDLYDMWWKAQLNESDPEYVDVLNFIDVYNLGVSLALNISLGCSEQSGLTENGIKEIMETWKIAVEEGFIQV